MKKTSHEEIHVYRKGNIFHETSLQLHEILGPVISPLTCYLHSSVTFVSYCLKELAVSTQQKPHGPEKSEGDAD